MPQLAPVIAEQPWGSVEEGALRLEEISGAQAHGQGPVVMVTSPAEPIANAQFFLAKHYGPLDRLDSD